MRLSSFLRTILKLDGISCLLIGAALLLFLQPLVELSGLSAELLLIAGGLLLPVGVFFLWLGSRDQAAAALVMLAVVGNLGWVGASALVAAGWPGITTLGQAAVALQAVAVLAIAGVEWLGYRRFQAQPAIA